MIYKEYLPPPDLQDKVECYWKFIIPASQSESAKPIPHIVLPHGCSELVFIKLLAINQELIVFKGTSTSKFTVDVFPDAIYAGIRLKPGHSKWLCAAPVAELLNERLLYPAADWHSWQKDLIVQISAEMDIQGLLNAALLDWKGEIGYQPHERINLVTNRIVSDRGKTSIIELADLACLSVRQLQRVFKRETGMSIKQFSQIKKLRHAILQLYFKQQNQNEMIVDHDYTDLSHFYKSFRNIAQYKLEDFFKYIDLIDHQQIV